MDDALVGTAYHEAGHAVAALVLSLPLETVTIEGLSKFWNPIARCEPDTLGPNERSIIEKAIVMWLAGYYAEQRACPQNDAKFGAQGCIEVASDFAELLAIQPGADEKAKDIFRRSSNRARRLAAESLEMIADVAELLIAERTVTCERVVAVLGADRIAKAREACSSDEQVATHSATGTIRSHDAA